MAETEYMFSPVMMAFIGSCVTWMCTLLGAAAVFLEGKKKFSHALMEGLLGLSGGVMLAASFFSLLAPALEMSKNLSIPGWIPLLSGFTVGVVFIKFIDLVVPEDPTDGCFKYCIRSQKMDEVTPEEMTENIDLRSTVDFEDRMRRKGTNNNNTNNNNGSDQINIRSTIDLQKSLDFSNVDGVMNIPKKMLLMVLAVTIHNIPEGLVLGMAYGGLAHENGTKFHDAIMLTLALGLQNIPEGLAVSVPIWRSGSRRITSFCYGQLSGFVEVIAAVIGCLLVTRIKMILPYALCFAAGAMIYVVCKELIPASQASQKQWGISGVMVGCCI